MSFFSQPAINANKATAVSLTKREARFLLKTGTYSLPVSESVSIIALTRSVIWFFIKL